MMGTLSGGIVLRFVTVWSSRAAALSAAIAFAIVAAVGLGLAFGVAPADATPVEAGDFRVAFTASAIWSLAVALLAAFLFAAVLDRTSPNSLTPPPAVARSARAGGALIGAGIAIGLGLLPALIVSPIGRLPLLSLVALGMFVMPSAGGIVVMRALQNEDEDFGDDDDEIHTLEPVRRLTPKAPTPPRESAASAARPAAARPGAPPARRPPPEGPR